MLFEFTKLDVRMVALDLDGTLLRSDKSVSQYTREALQKCRAQGVLIAVATARSEEEASKFTGQIPHDMVISNGGALVRRGKEILYEAPLSAQTTDGLLLGALGSRGYLSSTVQMGDDYFFYGAWNPKITDDPGYRTARYCDLSQPLGRPSYKVTLQSSCPEEMERLAARFPECRLTAFAGENWYRFAHTNATKYNAVAAAAKACGVPMEHVAAFGDDYIDIEMVAGCGFGVAVDNAIPELKAAAQFCCRSNEEDGVALWLSRHVCK